MQGRYIDVTVEEHEAIPDGCELRFHAVGEPRPVTWVRYEPMVGPDGDYEVTAADGSAWAVPVDDSSAGTSLLIYGGARGLRLRDRATPGAAEIAEPYLLLAADTAWG
jgi:hypothetical protein